MLTELYFLGDYLEDELFENAVIYEFVSRAGKYDYPDDRAINAVYEGTSAGSRIRRRMVDAMCGSRPASWSEGVIFAEKYHTDFVKDVFSRFLSSRSQPRQDVSRGYTRR